MVSINENQQFHGNRLPDENDDLFGFSVVADRVSSAIVSQSLGQCLVVGLEGEWGSGKSSLLMMLQRRLESSSAKVIRFEPWMVGPREALISELLSGLDTAVEELEGETVGRTANSIAGELRKYAGSVAAVGRAAGLAGALGLPFASAASGLISKTAEAMKEGIGDVPLTTLKARSTEALGNLLSRIVVLIDDIDRLEPKEAVEVLRLVQSVADFPNVTYVLCYDRLRLSESITRVTGLQDGAAYLEKIVQIVYPVPQPQRSALRNMFINRLKAVSNTGEFDDRLSQILIDHVGPRLRTPRAIVRILDSIKLLWPALENKVDLADLVWLQIIRIEDIQLYRWIEEYISEAVEMSNNIDQIQILRSTFSKSLEDIIRPKQALGLEWKEIMNFLPVVTHKNNAEDALFSRPHRDEILKYYNQKRLSSTDHARLYFGLLRPAGAMTDEEMNSFLISSENAIDISQKIMQLGLSQSHSGLARFEIIIDQLENAVDRMSSQQIKGFIQGILMIIDNLIDNAIVSDQTVFRQSIGKIISDMHKKSDPNTWNDLLKESIKTANATKFFTKEFIYKDEIFFLSWAGDATQDILKYLSKKYQDYSIDDYIKDTNIIKTIDLWRYADESSAKNFLKFLYLDDDNFVIFINHQYNLIVENSSFGVLGEAIFLKFIEKNFGVAKTLRSVLQHEKMSDDSREYDFAKLASFLKNNEK